MVQHRLALAATLAAALAACGTEDPAGPPPGPTLENPEAYFGLEACTCYEYVPVDGGPNRLGVAVESITSQLSGSDAEEHVVRYRLNGAEIRQDVFQPGNPDLLLRQATIGGQTGDTWVADPLLPWLRFPVEGGKTVTETATMRLQGTETVEEVSFRTNYIAEEVQASLTEGGEPQTFSAVRTSYQGLPFTEEPRWFVPETGWVRLELDIAGQRTRWVLNNKRTLGGGCPWAYGAAPDDICGIPDTTTETD